MPHTFIWKSGIDSLTGVIDSMWYESQITETRARGVSNRINIPGQLEPPIIPDICRRGPCNYGKEFLNWPRKKKY